MRSIWAVRSCCRGAGAAVRGRWRSGFPHPRGARRAAGGGPVQVAAAGRSARRDRAADLRGDRVALERSGARSTRATPPRQAGDRQGGHCGTQVAPRRSAGPAPRQSSARLCWSDHERRAERFSWPPAGRLRATPGSSHCRLANQWQDGSGHLRSFPGRAATHCTVW